MIDLQESGSMDLNNVGFLVIDEADRMFDMGFYPDLRTLIKVLPNTNERQTMLFSATLNTYVKNLAWEYTEDAKEITIECESITVSEIDQFLYHVSSDDKMKLLCGILLREKPESVIVFCNTKRASEVIAKRLQYNGFETEFIIGDLPQSKRLQIIDSFKKGSLKCLVATDIAARGIDIDDLAMVINFDLPNEAENYVHRIGRTARAGKRGKAYTFCSEQDVYNLPSIERYIEMSIPSEVADETLMAEDKSDGIYIKITNYYDDEHDFKNYSREKKYSREKRGKYDGKRQYNSNRSGIKTGYKQDSYKKYSKKQNTIKDFHQDAEQLSKLSFEERMKVYKQKYASNNQLAASLDKNKNSKQNGKKRYNGKNTSPKSNSQKNRQISVNHSNAYSKKYEAKKLPDKSEKLGIFAKIKNLFNKKGK